MSPENEKALRRAIVSGIDVAIASGRAFSTIPKPIFEIDEIQYAVTSNGASIYHMQSDQCIHAHKLEPASVKKIIEIIQYEPDPLPLNGGFSLCICGIVHPYDTMGYII